MASVVATQSNNPGFPPPPPSQPPGPTPARRRNYQACDQCRDRKVACPRGDVDNPHGPPCGRCRRENKLCTFSPRRTRKYAAKTSGTTNAPAQYSSPYSNSTPSTAGLPQLPGWGSYQQTFPPHSTMTPSNTAAPQFPGWVAMPGGFYGQQRIDQGSVEEQDDIDRAAALLQSREVFNGHDALHLLAEASRQTADREDRRGGTDTVERRDSSGANENPAGHPQGSHGIASPQVARASGPQGAQLERHKLRNQSPTIDPAIATLGLNGALDDEQHMKSALNAWSKSRFVRAGWFKAQEGVSYVDYFYTFLYPLTPITIPNFHHPSTHAKLLSQEPMLAVTVLMVSSRYMKLSGPGAATRLHFIHAQLWSFLQSMIHRMILGQEQFGGGFCGAGSRAASDVDPLSRKGLRTLGSVESLLLLTEWHPQALHFPPGDDSDELLISEDANVALADGEAACSQVEESVQRGIGGRRMDSWLEPCWRSDRMCWTLLGIALSLAYEIGVFDQAGIDDLPRDNPSVPAEALRAYCRRRNNVKELLLIYITQTSGRLGLTSMLPKTFSDPSSLNKTPAQKLDDRMSQMLSSLPQGDVSLPLNDGFAMEERIQGTVLYFWLEISSLMKTGNQQLFANRRHTRDIIKSGRYVDLLQQFQPALRTWKREFDQCDAIPFHMRHILTIEFEYCRVYLNSLALQAVVERCTNNTPAGSGAHLPTAHDPNASQVTGGGIPFSTLRKWLDGDQHNIQEVVNASRSLLQVVVDGLYPGDYLKHCPTFVLGATKDDAAFSLGLMDRAVTALRTCIVDDVHVGNQFADLLETLTNRVRSCFGRLAALGNGVSSRGSRSPAAPLEGQQPPPNGTTRTQTDHLAPPLQFWNGEAQQLTDNNATEGVVTPRIAAGGPPYDMNSNNFTFMPPPPSTFPYGQDNNSAQAGNEGLFDDNGNFRDWIALPLDPLLNLNSADVTQTTYGPDVGGYDLLELLLNVQGAEGTDDDVV